MLKGLVVCTMKMDIYNMIAIVNMRSFLLTILKKLCNCVISYVAQISDVWVLSKTQVK